MKKYILVSEKKIEKKLQLDKFYKFIFLIFTILSASIVVIVIFFIVMKGTVSFTSGGYVNNKLFKLNVLDFITGFRFSYGEGIYGALFLVINTIYVTSLALLLAIPTSIFTGIFISKVAPSILKKVLNYSIEMLVAVPSVIFGLFGLGVISPMIKSFGATSLSSTLAGVLVLSLMILPTLTMMNVTAFNSVPKSLINGSLALGATKTETNFKVVLKSAKSGIFSGIILSTGRALGEATAVSMVFGNSSGWDFSLANPFNLLGTTSTLTSTMLLEIHEASGFNYNIRFSLGILLMILILVSNLLLSFIKRRMKN